jgi:sn-glycerol 3-phosphate transport system substrate-binding protein
MIATRFARRSLAALLPLALVAAACGGGGDDDGGGGGGGGGDGEEAVDPSRCPVDALEEATAPVEVTFWHAMGGAETEATMNEVVDAYNASQDRVVVTAVNQQSYEDNFASYRDSTPEDRPSLVQLPEYYVQAMADSGTTVPIGACVEASGFDTGELLDRAVGYYTLEGVLQTMPFNVSGPILYYNRTMFEAAGLDPDAPPATLEELREASQAIVDSGAATYGIALETGFDSGGAWLIEQMFAGAGELYADNDNGRSARATEVLFDSEFGVEMFTFFQDMVDDGLAVNVGENAAGTDNLFKLADPEEPAAMTIFSSAALSSVMGALDGGIAPGFTSENLGIGRLPTPGGVTVGGASLWLVEDQEPAEIAATWDFIQFLVSAQTQSTWAEGTGYVPINNGALELDPLAATYTADPRFQVAFDQLTTGETNEATAGPVLGPARQIRGIVAAALQEVLSAGADPQEALTAAAEESDGQLEDYADRTGTG